jgi:hypothetical protein
MELFALKSSNHRDRTPTERKTERAFHLLRFLGTERDAEPPVFSQPHVRRDIVLPPQVTEEDKKQGLDKADRKPGESQEAYELRCRLRHRKKEEEWK